MLTSFGLTRKQKGQHLHLFLDVHVYSTMTATNLRESERDVMAGALSNLHSVILTFRSLV